MVLALLLATPMLFAQEEPPRATEIPTEGFWPTRLMIERFFDRAVDEMTEQYHFDDDQRERTRELLRTRVPEWMNANRPEIQTLMNLFIEAQMHDQPPTPDDVAVWAERAQPLLGEFEEVFVGITDSMREYLTEEQTTLLDAELAAFQAGVGMVKNKVAIWADGGYDPQTEWTPPGDERRKREREERQKMHSAMDEARDDTRAQVAQDGGAAAQSVKAAPPIAAPAEEAESQPTDEWALYTTDFIKRFDLNHEQKQKATAMLRAKQDERDQFFQQKSRELERVTQMAFAAKSPEAHQKARAAFEKLNEPVGKMFEQLKEKLETLPTRAQRRAAEIRESRKTPVASQPVRAPSNP